MTATTRFYIRFRVQLQITTTSQVKNLRIPFFDEEAKTRTVYKTLMEHPSLEWIRPKENEALMVMVGDSLEISMEEMKNISIEQLLGKVSCNRQHLLNHEEVIISLVLSSPSPESAKEKETTEASFFQPKGFRQRGWLPVEETSRMRIRIKNKSTGRSKDLLLDLDDDKNVFEAIYNNPMVKKANIRKWPSNITQHVKNGTHEIRCLVGKETLLSVAALKETSLNQLLIYGEEYGLVSLELQCHKVKKEEHDHLLFIEEKSQSLSMPAKTYTRLDQIPDNTKDNVTEEVSSQEHIEEPIEVILKAQRLLKEDDDGAKKESNSIFLLESNFVSDGNGNSDADSDHSELLGMVNFHDNYDYRVIEKSVEIAEVAEYDDRIEAISKKEAPVVQNILSLTDKHEKLSKSLKTLIILTKDYQTAMHEQTQARSKMFQAFADMSQETPLFVDVGNSHIVETTTQTQIKSLIEDVNPSRSMIAFQRMATIYSSNDTTEFQQEILDHLFKWDNAIAAKVDGELETFDKLEEDLYHYECKVDNLRRQVNTGNNKRKLSLKLSRNKGKLQKAASARNGKLQVVCALLKTVTDNSWKDLLHIVEKTMAEETHRFEEEMATVRELMPPTLEHSDKAIEYVLSNPALMVNHEETKAVLKDESLVESKIETLSEASKDTEELAAELKQQVLENLKLEYEINNMQAIMTGKWRKRDDIASRLHDIRLDLGKK